MALVDFGAVIIGAGISGINSAYRVKTKLLGMEYVIFEARNEIGGTWDFWKYPGLRSDSELHTYGFTWNIWNRGPPIAQGQEIKDYIVESAKIAGIDEKIKFGHRVKSANWNSKYHIWELKVESNGVEKPVTCRFLIFASGYYSYDEPLKTDIPGIENFQGKVIHPQFWPQDFDYSGKEIAIIGSGATAVTLVPKLAEKAKYVTMVQRSPSYIYCPDNVENTAHLYSFFPHWVAYRLLWAWFVIAPVVFYQYCIRYPNAARNTLRKQTEPLLPDNVPFDPHFNPKYGPWRQRMNVSPNGVFFKALRDGNANVATGKIQKVEKDAIMLTDGKRIQADVIVTATGLNIRLGGGIKLTVDGETVSISEKFLWRGMMMEDVPNAYFLLGYINASWNLGADSASLAMVRMINRMLINKHTAVIPRINPHIRNVLKPVEIMDLVSTYVSKGKGAMPKAAEGRGPWGRRINYFTDMYFASLGNLDNGIEYMTRKPGSVQSPHKTPNEKPTESPTESPTERPPETVPQIS